MTDKQKSISGDVLGTCWQLARQGQTAQELDPVARVEAVETLRGLADTLEKNPEKLLSLVVMGAVYTDAGKDNLGIHRTQITSAPSLAAWFLTIHEEGKKALEGIRSDLINMKLTEMLDEISNKEKGAANVDKG